MRACGSSWAWCRIQAEHQGLEMRWQYARTNLQVFRARAMGLGSLPDDTPRAPRRPLNLQALLVPRPGSTVLLRVSGSSMRDAGIHPGDLVVVDRSLRPRPGLIVVALLADGFTLKRLMRQAGRLVLQPANPAFPVLPLPPGEELQLWGVALHVIRRLA